MKPEVAIYLSKVRQFLKNSPKERDYMLSYITEDEFFIKLEQISDSKFETKGIAELTVEEFELLRQNMFKDEMIFYKKSSDNENIVIDYQNYQESFIDLGVFGVIGLN